MWKRSQILNGREERYFMRDNFAKASTVTIRNVTQLMEEDIEYLNAKSGAKNFRRAALGTLGWKAEKSLDEMAELLQKTRVTSSLSEGREFAPQIIGKSLECPGYRSHLAFDYDPNTRMYTIRAEISGAE